MARRVSPARACKDCPTGSKRPAPYAGPRCYSHHKTVVKARRQTSHGNYVASTYGITEERYWALYELQGRKCYICRRATGKTKHLAVDHDHLCCPDTPTCGRCNRGLLCRGCNRDVLGHLRDSIEALQRAIDYLTDPPARKVLS